MTDNQLLGDFVADIYDCDTVDERFRRFEQYIQKLGFESASYTFIPSIVLNTSLDAPPVFVRSSLFPESFIEQYITDRFDQRDFTIRAIKDNIFRPMDWHECIQDDYLTSAEKHVLFLAEHEHGIRNGLSIPVMNEDIGMAGFSVINTINDNNFDQLKAEKLETLHLCAQAFHDIVFPRTYAYHEFIPDSLLKMTEKEKIVLNFIAQGRTMRELGESDEPVSRRFGEALLLRLRERFGSITTHELIRYATQLRLL